MVMHPMYCGGNSLHKSLSVLVSVALLPSLSFASRDNEVLIFEDNFDTFNLSVWKHEITLSGEGNWEFEAYLNNRSTSYVTNSSLIINPNFLNATYDLQNTDLNLWGGDPSTACTDNGFYGCERTGGGGGNILNPIQSARIRTAETFAFKYGRVEVSAKLPVGEWLWPAIWLMPSSSRYGTWPSSGEIDIMESKGNARGYPGGGCESFSSTLHFGPFWPADAYENAHAQYSLPTGDLSQDFHTYGFFWNQTNMYTYIDTDDAAHRVLNIQLSSGNGPNSSFWQLGGFETAMPGISNPWEGQGANAPFDSRFYLIMNVAVGGTNGYFPDNVGNKPWSDTSSNAIDEFWAAAGQWSPTWTSPFTIDSVKVWQLADDPESDYAYRLLL